MPRRRRDPLSFCELQNCFGAVVLGCHGVFFSACAVIHASRATGPRHHRAKDIAGHVPPLPHHARRTVRRSPTKSQRADERALRSSRSQRSIVPARTQDRFVSSQCGLLRLARRLTTAVTCFTISVTLGTCWKARPCSRWIRLSRSPVHCITFALLADMQETSGSAVCSIKTAHMIRRLDLACM